MAHAKPLKPLGHKMRKDRIRRIVADYLASLGYSEAQYSWPKAGRLQVLTNADALPSGNPKLVVARNGFKSDNPLAGCFQELRLPAGTSRSALFLALEAIPRRGAPRIAIYKPAALSREIQLEHEVFA